MFKDNRYINAGTNEFYRYGKKAQGKVEAALTLNENGYYSILADGGKYWTFGTSSGKYGDFAKIGDTIFSVNKGGFIYAKAGNTKAAIKDGTSKIAIVYEKPTLKAIFEGIVRRWAMCYLA